MSSFGQDFLKKRKNSNLCLNSDNDDIFGIVSGFDIFCFDEITAAQSFSIKGRVAAKNSIKAGNVAINSSYGQDCTKHDFKYAVYADQFQMGSGQIHGGIHYGTKLNIMDYQKEDLERNQCKISKDESDNLDFEAIEKRINEISTDLGKVVSNAKVSYK